MDVRSNYSRLSAMQQTGDNDQIWQEFYTEDIVRRISGLDQLVGRNACRRQVQDFFDGLKAPPTTEQLTIAFDDENTVSVVEYDQSFSHKTYGDIAHRIIMVQRWREDQIYDETIYVMPRDHD
ncbi:MAG: hypothetical protein JRC99_12650 [Deltaproteobacteria bacterium]|nr:hypothetical protein [Deltaproteobacteria bacterium]